MFAVKDSWKKTGVVQVLCLQFDRSLFALVSLCLVSQKRYNCDKYHNRF